MFGLVRTEVFFLIDSGSTLPGALGASFNVGLGVTSLLPVGSNGWRLLRGRGDRLGVTGGCVMFTNVVSSVRSASTGGPSFTADMFGLLRGGKGEGVRGPIGRRSDECRDSDRGLRGDRSGLHTRLGVIESGRGVVDLWLCDSEGISGNSLEDLENGRALLGGSSFLKD